jgi:hypothetical protein
MAVTIYGSGQVPIQIVQSVTASVFSSTSQTYTDITGLSVSITPKSSSNKVLVLVNASLSGSNDGMVRLVRNGSVISGANGTSGATQNGYALTQLRGNILSMNFNYLDSPATTSATTYGVQAWVTGGNTVYLNRRADDTNYGGVSSIIVMEVAYA